MVCPALENRLIFGPLELQRSYLVTYGGDAMTDNSFSGS